MAGVPIEQTLGITLGRFLGAVFLHTLCSGIVGYFLARSLLLRRKRKSLVGLGIFIATCLHGIYNYIIIKIAPYDEKFIIMLIVLLGLMALSVLLAFKNLNKLKSICKI